MQTTKKTIVSLFDESGNMVREFAKAGYACYCFDIKNRNSYESFPSGGYIAFLRADLYDKNMHNLIVRLDPVLLFAFPPCTDLAVSGAMHFEKKRKRNPLYRHEAMQLVYAARDIAERVGCPYMIENPVSVIATEWRKPNFSFSPYEYGGYLPENDIHPRFPEYILPRDAYPKKTCLWTGNGFTMPEKDPVPVAQGYSIQHRKLGGKSEKTKTIRSETPRGFAKAIFLHFHAQLCQVEKLAA